MIASGNHTTIKSWQPERADLSARRRYASEQPPQAALSESQRGFLAQFTDKPLRLTFVRHLPFQGRHGHFVPAIAILTTSFTNCLLMQLSWADGRCRYDSEPLPPRAARMNLRCCSMYSLWVTDSSAERSISFSSVWVVPISSGAGLSPKTYCSRFSSSAQK